MFGHSERNPAISRDAQCGASSGKPCNTRGFSGLATGAERFVASGVGGAVSLAARCLQKWPEARMERLVKPISYKRHRFPAEVIRYAVWLYYRFTLSYRDVEELLAQRGVEVSYETIRCCPA